MLPPQCPLWLVPPGIEPCSDGPLDRRKGKTMRMLKTLVATLALVLLPPASRPCHPTQLTLVIAFLLGATVLMAPAAASALVCIDGSDNPCPLLPGFNISAFA